MAAVYLREVLMKKLLTMLMVGCIVPALYASICPDPNTSSLRWGEIPAPWIESPFSMKPQGEPNARFVRAQVLVAGYGRGVACFYKNSLGEYSIWWPVLVRIPSSMDYHWIKNQNGFVCSYSLDDCEFTTAI